jgi:hypothetical protein
MILTFTTDSLEHQLATVRVHQEYRCGSRTEDIASDLSNGLEKPAL